MTIVVVNVLSKQCVLEALFTVGNHQNTDLQLEIKPLLLIGDLLGLASENAFQFQQ